VAHRTSRKSLRQSAGFAGTSQNENSHGSR
jgi:hypothetical protein